jgi:GINS complex subunit 1
MLQCSLLTRLYSAINLTKNSQFYVRQGDVERLIQQGYLQKLS